MKKTVAILAGGGPAPGINTVISSVAKVFLKYGHRVIGVHNGFEGLFEVDPDIVELTFAKADRAFTRGGSILQMSRFKPKEDDLNTDLFVDYNVGLLVTIGGDDTASTANRIAKYLAENNLDVKNIHVPKTIDNDLPLPQGVPTFGYNSALDEGTRIAKTVYEDARTSQNWFVMVAMGRSAGHLAFGIGAASHLPMIIVPEMFNKVELTADRIANLVISSILKRILLGMKYGVAMISEGVFHFMSNDEIKKTGANFTYDAHGHPELFNVSKAHVFSLHIQRKLVEAGLRTRTRPMELGFGLRCAQPIGYDLRMCTELGMGVYSLFKSGHTSCMVSVDHTGKVSPIYLKDVEDENGKIKPRLLDIESEGVRNTINMNLHFIEEQDYEAASTFVNDPSIFDFKNILGW